MTYQQFVAMICKPGSQILIQLTPSQAHQWHMAAGVSGEAGELLDALKKHCIYQKPLDVENVKEEIGDILFYLTGLLNELGMTLDECLKANHDKLTKRYPNFVYTNEDALKRADKMEVVEEKKDVDSIDDELADVVIERVACNIGDEECESCQ